MSSAPIIVYRLHLITTATGLRETGLSTVLNKTKSSETKEAPPNNSATRPCPAIQQYLRKSVIRKTTGTLVERSFA